MSKLANIDPKRVFKYFEDISSIARGSGNMQKVSDYCMNFAKVHSLRAVRDDANNVVIYKKATKGYENSDTVILQGHLDMVCQKDEGVKIDFEKDGLDIFADGDYIKANGTTLGADDGIAVAMMFAILESDTYEHPAIEAVFTTDEETGMIGALNFDFSLLSGKRMINIDCGDQDILTVSCAGGSDFEISIPLTRTRVSGKTYELVVRGLKGGHSGVEIDKGRVNANILMSRILKYAGEISDYKLVSIDGGDKGNAIPAYSRAKIVLENTEDFVINLSEYVNIIKNEIKFREQGFEFDITAGSREEVDAIHASLTDKIVFMLLSAPNGVVNMSAEIENLVETSLNLGILKTDTSQLVAHFTLRSNKKSALKFLEDRMKVFAQGIGGTIKTFGHYPPWEFKSDSKLQALYKEKYKNKFGTDISVEAIHAGLECGVFSSSLTGLDCIAVGPQMYDIHTPRERLSISSTQAVFEIVLDVLKSCK